MTRLTARGQGASQVGMARVAGLIPWALALSAGSALANEGANEHGGMPQLNVHDFAPQLFWLAVLFTIFYLIVSRVALPGIASVLATRQAKLDADLSAASRLKDEAEAALKAYETALAQARATAAATVAAKNAELAAQTDAHKKAVEADLNQRLAQAAGEIRAKRDGALANVRVLATEAAGQVVARLLGEAPEADAAAAAVDAALSGTR